jgi:hypothetical protein
VAGQQLADALEERLAGEAELEGEVILEALRVRFDRRQERHERLGLGREVQDAVDLGVHERLDPEAVAGGEQLAPALVPDRVRVHAPQFVQRAVAPAAVGGEDDLGVAVGLEVLAGELGADLGVVVGLPVVGDPAAGDVAHGLVAVREVDDAQAPVREADVAALVRPHVRVVGAAVGEELAHDPELVLEARDRLAAQRDDAADAAHVSRAAGSPASDDEVDAWCRCRQAWSIRGSALLTRAERARCGPATPVATGPGAVQGSERTVGRRRRVGGLQALN